MQYRQITPPEELREYVRYYWTLESPGANQGPQVFAPTADGCPGMVFQQPDIGTYFQYDKQLPPIFLYGQTTRYMELFCKGRVSTIGICLYPTALYAVFGIAAHELTDTCLDLDMIAASQGIHLSGQLQELPDIQQRIQLITTFLIAQIKRNKTIVDPVTQYALSQIMQSNGTVTLKELHKETRLSERSFERKFKQTVGITPKLFSRICRFQSTLSQLRNNQYDKLSDIAFENEYADQSHYIRSFKEFAGISPFQYQKQSKEAWTDFPMIIK
ncbi:helix-turn-helix domain-containing protein [Chitinophaga pendula]|uniref:helix-turn-helix domain-containing protein n=1 Tax=Chitinophaga TaxID=79328 RepID=UPI000BB03444|nr:MULTISPECIES: helix-turn-helix domain-containing protein [Chitinophaga]ASZ12961.1 AraC family transcriptional regulator [Chitinophaga sp. MD30]UCJ09406.1 helix-turn-helix domain-containing protein [Chitinophaga pendula]